MCNDIVPRSQFRSTELTKEDAYDVIEVARQSGKITEIVRVAEEEMSSVTGNSIGTLADLTVRAANISRLLTDKGYRSGIFDEGSLMLLQVTKQNISNYKFKIKRREAGAEAQVE